MHSNKAISFINFPWSEMKKNSTRMCLNQVSINGTKFFVYRNGKSMLPKQENQSRKMLFGKVFKMFPEMFIPVLLIPGNQSKTHKVELNSFQETSF